MELLQLLWLLQPGEDCPGLWADTELTAVPHGKQLYLCVSVTMQIVCGKVCIAIAGGAGGECLSGRECSCVVS